MRRSRESGISLLEVLITISILSFGVMGVASMQTSAISNTHLSAQYSQAALFAQNIAEGMQANSVAAIGGLYRTTADSDSLQPAENCSANACTPSQRAAWDIARWRSMLSESDKALPAEDSAKAFSGLAGGKFSIDCHEACGADSIHVLTIYWDARRNGASGTGCDDKSPSDLTCFHLAYTL